MSKMMQTINFQPIADTKLNNKISKLLKTKIGAQEGLSVGSVFQSTVCYDLNVNCFKGLVVNWCQCGEVVGEFGPPGESS